MRMHGVKINTIQEMENLYYSKAGAKIIQKSDAPVISTTTGVYNAVYGAEVWALLNRESNAFGLLPKLSWGKSGWRVITARPASSGGGVAENGTIPDTIKPDFAELSCKPKSIVHTFDVSETQEFLASQSDDDAIGNMEQMRATMGIHHKEMMNVMLLTDIDTTAGDNLESVDRVCASKDEIDNCGLSDATDGDIYGIDRDGSTTYDAQVDHNSGSDRVLTDPILRNMIVDTLEEAGANTTFILTRADTKSNIISLYNTQVRYNQNSALGETSAKISVNGVETDKGLNFGVKVTTVYGLPLFTSKNVVRDTIGRIYLLDTSNPEGFSKPRLGIDIAKPTQYFEAGMNMGTPFAINRLGNEGMYRTMGELKCRHFKSQGKIRDLKAS